MIKLPIITAACLALSSAPAFALSLTEEIIGAGGQPIGSVKIETAVGGVLVRVNVGKGKISTGWHGMHFHSIGDCSDIGKFKKSAGHMGKKEGAHGLKNARGPEFGDMPNIYAPHQHDANAEFYVPGITISGTATDGSVLLDADGSALVIHEKEDDHISQPIGGSGGRIACAQIK